MRPRFNICDAFCRRLQRIKSLLKSNYFPRVNGLFAAVLWLCMVALTATAQAQTPSAQRPTDAPPAPASPTPSPSPAATTATDNHDLSITANVTARELRFEIVPDPKVEFPGQPRRDTVWEAERTNLPAQVQPGVTYRDIGIRLKITSVFADIERIVAEALGEISASDDGNNAPQTPEMNASAAPQVNHAPSAPPDATHANAAPQAASLTQTARAASAATKPTPTRKNNSPAPARRGRP
jgi:hypothetical protein